MALLSLSNVSGAQRKSSDKACRLGRKVILRICIYKLLCLEKLITFLFVRDFFLFAHGQNLCVHTCRDNERVRINTRIIKKYLPSTDEISIAVFDVKQMVARDTIEDGIILNLPEEKCRTKKSFIYLSLFCCIKIEKNIRFLKLSF